MAIAGNGWRRISIARILKYSTTTCTPCARMVISWRESGRSASLAGHLKLSNLCWIYDHNNITLDGPANWSFSEDVMTRFVGYGWNVTRVADANDLAMLGRAFETFLKTTDRPT